MPARFERTHERVPLGGKKTIRLLEGEGLTVTSSNTAMATLRIGASSRSPSDRILEISGVGAGRATITASQGSRVVATMVVEVGSVSAREETSIAHKVFSWYLDKRVKLDDSLAEIPEKASKKLGKQKRKLAKRLVDEYLPDDLVPREHRGQFPIVKQHLASTLLGILNETALVQGIESCVDDLLTTVVTYLREKLSLHSSIVSQRKRIEAGGRTNKHEMVSTGGEMSQAVQRWLTLDRETERSLETKIKPKFKFKPKLVLDPSKRFLEEVLIGAGIKIKNNGRGFRATVMATVEVTDPLAFDKTTSIYGGVEAKAQYGNFAAYLRYAGTIRPGHLKDDRFQAGVNYRSGSAGAGITFEANNRFKELKLTVDFFRKDF